MVFKYASVTIPSGVTVTFKNNASRAPVVWLVQGGGGATPGDNGYPGGATGGARSADVGIQKNGNVEVFIQTMNFSTAGNVKLRVGPKYGNFTVVTAAYVSGNFTSATWRTTLTFNPGFSALQAIATAP